MGRIEVYPGDVIMLNPDWWQGGVKLVKGRWPLLVIAVFSDKDRSGLIGDERRRVLVMPAGEPRVYDMGLGWVEANAERLTMWQTRTRCKNTPVG